MRWPTGHKGTASRRHPSGTGTLDAAGSYSGWSPNPKKEGGGGGGGGGVVGEQEPKENYYTKMVVTC